MHELFGRLSWPFQLSSRLARQRGPAAGVAVSDSFLGLLRTRVLGHARQHAPSELRRLPLSARREELERGRAQSD
jgi:hypothetical protein